MAKKAEIKRYPLNMRTTKEVREKLERAAAASGRSLAQEVEFRIERSFDRELLAAETRKAIDNTILERDVKLMNEWARHDAVIGDAVIEVKRLRGEWAKQLRAPNEALTEWDVERIKELAKQRRAYAGVNWERIEGTWKKLLGLTDDEDWVQLPNGKRINWKELSDRVKQQWGKLTDDEADQRVLELHSEADARAKYQRSLELISEWFSDLTDDEAAEQVPDLWRSLKRVQDEVKSRVPRRVSSLRKDKASQRKGLPSGKQP